MKATRRFNAVAIVVAASLGLAAGSAQAEFFLKLGAIKGESTDPRHKDEIVVDSFQWGMGRTVATSMSFGGATLGKLCVSAITLTKQTDLATTSLIANTASGMNIAKAILIGRRSTGDAESFEYFRIELDNVKVGAFAISSGGDRPSESFSLSFTKARVVYTRQLDGGTSSPVETTIDLAKIGATSC